MFDTLIAIEYVACTSFTKFLADKMDFSYRNQVTEGILDASNLQFHCSQASSQMDEDIGEVIPENIVAKWITIRGHSFSKSILEECKRETKKKSTQKSKPLRSNLAASSTTSAKESSE